MSSYSQAVNLISKSPWPTPVLLTSPWGHASWELATQIHQHLDVASYDLVTMRPLTAERLNYLLKIRRWVAPFGDRELFILWIDNVPEQLQMRLLKFLEESHEVTKTILVGSRDPVETIVSRCLTIKLGEEEPIKESYDKVKPLINTAFRAINAKNAKLLRSVLDAWSEDAEDFLLTTCLEKITTRYHFWSEEDLNLVPINLAKTIVISYSNFVGVLPKLSGKVVLERFTR